LRRAATRTLEKRRAELAGMTPSSGNVFQDLELADAVALGIKVRLAVEINRLINAQQLYQVTAAKCLEVSRSKIAALKSYKLGAFSAHRLMSFLLALGQDVEIRVNARRAACATGRIVVRRMSTSRVRRGLTHA
jgi:predicted XRE-type DNA-binding protein